MVGVAGESKARVVLGLFSLSFDVWEIFGPGKSSRGIDP